ncbi:MAG: hypothetical protein JWO59_2463, partial [Chloroflexi bacterium]|nr:hypothetical protein [Chloroflexota bacterium]
MSALHRADALSPTRPETEQHAPSARSPLPQPADVLSVDAFSSAVSFLKALQLGQVSAAELLSLYRRRIRTYDPTLQVFVHLTVDAQTARTRGRLAGLPLTLEEGPARAAPTSTPGRLARKAGATIVG